MQERLPNGSRVSFSTVQKAATLFHTPLSPNPQGSEGSFIPPDTPLPKGVKPLP